MLSALGLRSAAATFTQVPSNKYYRLINHGPCVLIASGNDDKMNVAPVAWLTTVSDAPPLLALPVAARHYTAELIRSTGEFSVNIPGEDLLSAIIYVGKASGRNEDKMKLAGLTSQPGISIKTPYVHECLGHIECRVRQQMPFDSSILFIADVLYAQVRRDVFDDYWIPEKARTVHHLGSNYFAVTGKRFKVR